MTNTNMTNTIQELPSLWDTYSLNSKEYVCLQTNCERVKDSEFSEYGEVKVEFYLYPKDKCETDARGIVRLKVPYLEHTSTPIRTSLSSK